jgi:ATP-dependent DNA ligase
MSVKKVFSFEPMLYESIEWPPEGQRWHYELMNLKLDGFRAIGRKSGQNTHLWSRNHEDLSRGFPIVARGYLQCAV